MALGGIRGTTYLPGKSANNMDAARLKEGQADPNAPQQVMQNAAMAVAAFGGKPGEGPTVAYTEDSDLQRGSQPGSEEEAAADPVPVADPEAVVAAIGVQPTVGTRTRTSV